MTPVYSDQLTLSKTQQSLPARVDVVVVGAGLSGLMAARRLKENGLSVHVLEARDRTGGRMVRRSTAGGHFIDLGGQWGGQNHFRFKALVDELGLETYPTHKEGQASLVWKKQQLLASLAKEYDDGVLFLDPSQIGQPNEEVSNAQSVLKSYQKIVQSINLDAPWKTPNANELDRTTIRCWLEKNSNSSHADFMLALLSNVGGSGGFDVWDASILHSAWTQAVSPQREYPESWLVKGAAGQVAEILSAELAENISLSAPVNIIDQTGDGIRVIDIHSRVIHANAAIVAIPPPLRNKITFMPDLRPEARSFLQRNPMGSMIKVLAIYPQAFWRKKGMSGLGVGDLPTLQFLADSSTPDGTPGVIASFITASRAVEFQGLSNKDQNSAVLQDLIAHFGPEAELVDELVIQDWNNEPWSSGAFTSYVTPGAWTTYGQFWQEPHGRVYWAGTEASTRWRGYLEGALEAAEQAARAVLEKISVESVSLPSGF